MSVCLPSTIQLLLSNFLPDLLLSHFCSLLNPYYRLSFSCFPLPFSLPLQVSSSFSSVVWFEFLFRGNYWGAAESGEIVAMQNVSRHVQADSGRLGGAAVCAAGIGICRLVSLLFR